MHIITRKRLNDFVAIYPEAKPALQHWYKTVKSNNFKSFNELKKLFPHADQVGKLTVFNEGVQEAKRDSAERCTTTPA
ncbi:MAG: type II toxin-antitoxin system HigB family toxin [Methylococcaceae bacterium]|nr:MAG: type II toxin-antitoxin system HigB family toxin [Methylococcaceae bacterium]